jgi:hypothetical protein
MTRVGSTGNISETPASQRYVRGNVLVEDKDDFEKQLRGGPGRKRFILC